MKIKTGIGFDAHRFEEGRKLFIGGVYIPDEIGLAGHSDADVLLHAIVDAIAGPGLNTDIGGLFPDTDNKYKGIDSKLLLEEAVKKISEKGYKIANIDCTIIAQKPKMAPYIMQMQECIADICKVDELDDISVKATTTEKMGFTGRKEGIAALASATLIK